MQKSLNDIQVVSDSLMQGVLIEEETKKHKHNDICSKCRKEFVWENVSDVYAGVTERENIDCPSCTEINGTKMTSGRFEKKK